MKTRLQLFTAEVTAMREAQREYQALRQGDHTSQEWQQAKIKKKKAERLVDWWLAKLGEDPEQENLFWQEK